MKIALGQINTTIGDFQRNTDKIIEYSRRAHSSGAELILFPELSVCGYPPRDLVERPSFVEKNLKALERIQKETSGITVVCGLVTPAKAETGKSVLNSAAVIRDGEVELLQSKVLLPTYDVFDESRNFAAAAEQRLFQFDGKPVALTICEDAWNDKNFWRKRLYPLDPVEKLLHDGGKLLLNISASPFYVGKPKLREEMLAALARRHGVPVAMVNLVGGNDSLSSMVRAW